MLYKLILLIIKWYWTVINSCPSAWYNWTLRRTEVLSNVRRWRKEGYCRKLSSCILHYLHGHYATALCKNPIIAETREASHLVVQDIFWVIGIKNYCYIFWLWESLCYLLTNYCNCINVHRECAKSNHFSRVLPDTF